MAEKIILCCGSGRWLKIMCFLRIVEYSLTLGVVAYELKNTIEKIKEKGHDRKQPDYDLMFGSLVVAYLVLNLVYTFVLIVGSGKKMTGLLKAWIIWCIVGLIFGISLIIIRTTCLEIKFQQIIPIIVDMFFDLFVLWLAHNRLNEILAVRLRSDMLLNDPLDTTH